MNDLYYWTIAPQLVVLGTAILVLCLSMLVKDRHAGIHTLLGFTGLAVAGGWLTRLLGYHTTSFGNMVVVDGFSTILQAAIIAGAALSLLIASDHLSRNRNEHAGEYVSLLLFATWGMMLLATAADLIMVFLAIEVMSISVYVLTGFARRRDTSIEAALKYLVIGGFASAFLLYGIALIYGATGTTNLVAVRTSLASGTFGGESMLALLGTGFLLTGLGFKIGAVPFHMWAPDVYQGAPTPVTAFMSVGVKAAATGALARIALEALAPLSDRWYPALLALAILTMVAGNLLALRQTDLKRLLAYSSIAHAGYLLVGLAAAIQPGAGNQATAGILFYLLTYAVTNTGAFAVIIAVQPDTGERTSLSDFRGLSQKRPLMALLLTLFLLSLAGIPPLAGFAGKFYLFSAAIQSKLYLLAIAGVLSAVVGVYYYLRVIAVMYMEEPEASPFGTSRSLRPALVAGLAAAAILVMELGISAIPATGAFKASYFEAIRSHLQVLF
ncbi:MAG: NADH-quinone oxidoreductase subunit N [Deltaproteobacteria bacterium]|nr:NADH-quinone oxidoreductase subunit N [Deltaproteobacteria bacterium]